MLFIGMPYKGKWNATCFPMTWTTQMLLCKQSGTQFMFLFGIL